MKKIYIAIFVLVLFFVFQRCQQKDEYKKDGFSTFNTELVSDDKIDLKNTENLEVVEGLLSANSPCLVSFGCDYDNWFPFYDMSMPGTCDKFYANAHVYYCDDKLVIDEFVTSITECDDYNAYLSTLSNTSRVESLDSFDYEASLIYEKRLLELIGWGVGSCETGSETFAMFYKPLCYQWCMVDSGGPGKDGTVYYRKVICGNTCCLRTSEACSTEDGEIQISNPVFEIIGDGVCEGNDNKCEGYLLGECDAHTCGPSFQVWGL